MKEKGFTPLENTPWLAAESRVRGVMPRASSLTGFTLIEVIIYLALFAIVFGGAIVAAYNVFESNGRDQAKAMVQEEADFLIAKIDWALSGVKSATLPALPPTPPDLSSNGAVLSVTKYNFASNPVVISLSGTDLVISEGGNPPITLNNSNVQIGSLNFKHKNASGDGIDPESVQAVFIVSARAPNGMVIYQTASSTAYFRK